MTEKNYGVPAAVLILFAITAYPALAGTFSFSNVARNPHTGVVIGIPQMGAGSPYPSPITLGPGLITDVSDVNVRIFGLRHSFLEDVDILLVGPTGANVMLMRGVGGRSNIGFANFTFDDEAEQNMPNFSEPSSGAYKPTDHLANTNFGFYPSAPSPPYGAELSVFDGLDPTGTWFLYVQDVRPSNSGAIIDGWSLTFEANTYPKTPDLHVLSVELTDGPLILGEPLTVNVTLHNQGDESSPSTTLRCYRSPDSTISRSDVEIGTKAVPTLLPNATSAESIVAAGPTTTGSFWVGACVDAVTGESILENNCSAGVRVMVIPNTDAQRAIGVIIEFLLLK